MPSVAMRANHYLVSRKEQNVCARGVHLIALTRVNGFFLHGFNLQGFKFLIENLTLAMVKVNMRTFILVGKHTRSITTFS
jgi:hypothetical protein